MKYTPSNVCSREISFEVAPDNTVHDVHFTGGCHGNTQGVSRLVEGMDIHEVIARLDGINCRGRGTSCPDQLSKALKQYLAQA